MSNLVDVTLATVDSGKLEEKFAASLRRIVNNIHDPNTKPDEKREIIVKLTIVPTKEDRGICSLTTSCVEKLAKEKEADSMFYCGIDTETGEIGVKQRVPEQPSLFDGLTPPVGKDRKVVEMRG